MLIIENSYITSQFYYYNNKKLLSLFVTLLLGLLHSPFYMVDGEFHVFFELKQRQVL